MVKATQKYAFHFFSKEAHYAHLIKIYMSTIENYK